MAKYKLCPGCGLHADPSLVECPDCEADLVSVPVVDEDAAVQEEPAAPQAAVLVRRCECGAENPSQARKCSACGEDISDIVPTPAAAPAEEAAEPALLTLCTLDGQWQVDVPEGEAGFLLGRGQADCEYLRTHRYVSRNQARLTRTEGALAITSLSRSNPTFVNNVPLQTGETRALCEGDEIGLGGCVVDGARQDEAAYLVVRR